MDLITQTREKSGKSVKALRKEGFIPAELYGHDIENLHLSVNAKDFKKVFREAGENTLISLIIGNEKRNALIHDVQKGFLTNEVEHIDFYQVRMDEKLKTRVPIEIVGESPAVKEQGGILNKTMSEIEVEALPADLPSRFTVNLGSLVELNQSIYVKDIEVPTGVKVLVEPDTVVVTVSPPLKEEVAPEPAPDVSAVKVEGEEKKEEREKEKAATEEAK